MVQRRLKALGVVRATLLWTVDGFALGAAVSLLVGFNPWWQLPTMCAVSGVGLPVGFAIDRHTARTPYDGNDRSRVFPVRRLED